MRTGGPTSFMIWAVLWWVAPGTQAADGVTIDDLVRRAQIPLAAISADGRFVAYVSVRGDPLQNDYSLEVGASAIGQGGGSYSLIRYRLPSREVFAENQNFLPTAGTLRWTSDDRLLFLTRVGEKVRLTSWSAITHEQRSLTDEHDQIFVEAGASTDDRLALTTADFVPYTGGHVQVVDSAYRVRDGNAFFGPIKNPALGRWKRSQRYRLVTGPGSRAQLEGAPVEGWEFVPVDWSPNPGITRSAEQLIYRAPSLSSPDGKLAVATETGFLNLDHPNNSYTSARLVLVRANQTKILVPFKRPRPYITTLGWTSDSRAVYYVSVGPKNSTIDRVTLEGVRETIYDDDGQLERPGDFFGRDDQQVLTGNARTILLVRSTNTQPAELVALDVRTRRLSVVYSPNETFASRIHPEVRFYSIELPGEDVWGRLYLPSNYQPGRRYPLLFTQYYSQPGFYASTGDEIPIAPLTDNGIAVFTMQSAQLGPNSSVGDFRAEIARVQRPLDAMEWVYRKLVSEGLVEPDRIGVTGLSYGSEIAMYSYWRSKIFRAVSVGNGSWDLSLMPFGGVRFSSALEGRGFPLSCDNEFAITRWRELSAGANARASLPPLLLQSPDGEENSAVPTWSQLRRAGAIVEWYEYPNEGHVKAGPANRWWVYSRNLDWFRFWLKDEEDPVVAKAEQYQRWREMRSNWEAAKKQSGSAKAAQ